MTFLWISLLKVFGNLLFEMIMNRTLMIGWLISTSSFKPFNLKGYFSKCLWKLWVNSNFSRIIVLDLVNLQRNTSYFPTNELHLSLIISFPHSKEHKINLRTWQLNKIFLSWTRAILDLHWFTEAKLFLY